MGATGQHADDAPTAANTLWQRQGADTTSRSASRAAVRQVDPAQAKAQAANQARAKKKSADLAKQRAVTSQDRKKAAKAAKAARAAALKRAEKKNTSRSSSRPADRSTSAQTHSSSGTTTASGWTCVISGCGGTFTSGYGGRWGTMHLGDDFATPVGTPLHALHSGTVTAVGWYYGMGNRVEIDYGGGVSSVFAHMTSAVVSVGQTVSEGQLVGYSGNTGHSTGPHVHVEIHLNGTPVDPAPWLRAHGIF